MHPLLLSLLVEEVDQNDERYPLVQGLNTLFTELEKQKGRPITPEEAREEIRYFEVELHQMCQNLNHIALSLLKKIPMHTDGHH